MSRDYLCPTCGERHGCQTGALSLIRRATADEIAAEIKAEMETYFAGLFDPVLDEAADRVVEIARRHGGGTEGG
jgi:hypothetical protein